MPHFLDSVGRFRLKIPPGVGAAITTGEGAAGRSLRDCRAEARVAQMATLRLEGLIKCYGQVSALNGVDLDVADGEFFALLGPSAAGKTTTLRVIAGLETLDGGRVVLDGEDITRVPVKRRNMAMVFQSFALYPHLSTFDNLAYPLREAGLSRREIAPRVQRTAELLRITHTLKRKPASLSGGEQQRLAIGRAIIRQPRLFLLDEPLTNLDARLRGEMRDEIRALVKRMGVTVLLVTHDQEEALGFADRIAVMEKGVIQQCDTPQQLYEHPKNSLVARFLGELNELRGVREGGLVRVGDTSVLADATEEAPLTGDCLLAFRTEWARIGPHGAIGGVVESRVYLGHQIRVRVSTPHGSLWLNAPASVAVGDSVRFHVERGWMLAPR